MSPGSKEKSINLGGSVTADKQCGYGSTRVYFGVVLSRGVLGVAVFTNVAQFPGETPEGARLLVERLPGVLDEMLGCSSKKPRTLFTDRGPGFYHRRWGTITGDYESACREHGFKPWAGTNSKRGPVLSHPMWQIFSRVLVAEIGGADTPRQALGGDAWRVGAALAAGCALGQ